jgi:hypothetical protein
VNRVIAQYIIARSYVDDIILTSKHVSLLHTGVRETLHEVSTTRVEKTTINKMVTYAMEIAVERVANTHPEMAGLARGLRGLANHYGENSLKWVLSVLLWSSVMYIGGIQSKLTTEERSNYAFAGEFVSYSVSRTFINLVWPVKPIDGVGGLSSTPSVSQTMYDYTRAYSSTETLIASLMATLFRKDVGTAVFFLMALMIGILAKRLHESQKALEDATISDSSEIRSYDYSSEDDEPKVTLVARSKSPPRRVVQPKSPPAPVRRSRRARGLSPAR